jgi:hypothetical protein
MRSKRLIIGGLAAVVMSIGVSSNAWAAGENQTITAAISPTKLSSVKFTPVALRFTLDITGTGFGETTKSLPFPLASSQVKLPKDALVNSKGIPVCTPAKLENTTETAARAACKKAILGTGNASAQVELPGQGPIPAPAPVTAFNGPIQGGNPVFIIHAYTTVPAPTTFVVPGVFAKVGGGYSRGATFIVPPIAGGYGTLIHFDLTTGKKLYGKGKRKHAFGSARCRTGTLRAQGVFNYASGVSNTVDTIVKCKPIKPKKK